MLKLAFNQAHNLVQFEETMRIKLQHPLQFVLRNAPILRQKGEFGSFEQSMIV
jgi:hypothetical protein